MTFRRVTHNIAAVEDGDWDSVRHVLQDLSDSQVKIGEKQSQSEVTLDSTIAEVGKTQVGTLDFQALLNTEFIFVGHLISKILFNGGLAYTFTHNSEGVVQSVVNNIHGRVLTYSYNPNGTILTVTSTLV